MFVGIYFQDRWTYFGFHQLEDFPSGNQLHDWLGHGCGAMISHGLPQRNLQMSLGLTSTNDMI